MSQREEVITAADASCAEPIRIVGQTGSEICREWYRGADADANASMLMRRHVTGVVTEDGACISSDDAVALIEAGRVLDMVPPPCAPAHAAHVATGFPLLLQVKTCELCGQKVLFA